MAKQGKKATDWSVGGHTIVRGKLFCAVCGLINKMEFRMKFENKMFAMKKSGM